MTEPATPYFSRSELEAIGLMRFGSDVKIDRSCRLYGADKIELGSHVRIDAFSVLSAGEGGISIGNYVHIGVGSSLLGAAGVTLEDFSGVSARVCIFSANEDTSGESLMGPTIPPAMRRMRSARVVLRRHAAIGAGSVVLPGVEVGTGTFVGALCLVKRSLPEFTVFGGNPLRRVGWRKRTILELEKQLAPE